jgi:membrane protein YqaA with SNARE-associated domain
MKELKNRLEVWFAENADKPKAMVWLNVIAFFESSIFPLPLEPFLIMFVLVKPNKWLKFAINITFFSVVGALFAYFLGAFLYDTLGEFLVSFYSLQDEMVVVGEMLSSSAFVSIFLAAFTPIPYKVFVLSAGIFKLNIFVLLVASLIGRGVRFFLVAFIFRFFGKNYSKLIFKYFNTILLTLAILVLIYIVIQFL